MHRIVRLRNQCGSGDFGANSPITLIKGAGIPFYWTTHATIMLEFILDLMAILLLFWLKFASNEEVLNLENHLHILYKYIIQNVCCHRCFECSHQPEASNCQGVKSNWSCIYGNKEIIQCLLVASARFRSGSPLAIACSSTVLLCYSCACSDSVANGGGGGGGLAFG